MFNSSNVLRELDSEPPALIKEPLPWMVSQDNRSLEDPIGILRRIFSLLPTYLANDVRGSLACVREEEKFPKKINAIAPRDEWEFARHTNGPSGNPKGALRSGIGQLRLWGQSQGLGKINKQMVSYLPPQPTL